MNFHAKLAHEIKDILRDPYGRTFLITNQEVLLLFGNEETIERTWKSKHRHVKLNKIHFSENFKLFLISTNLNKIIIFDPSAEDFDKMPHVDLQSHVVEFVEDENLFCLCSDYSIYLLDFKNGGSVSMVFPTDLTHGQIRCTCFFRGTVIVLEDSTLILFDLSSKSVTRINDPQKLSRVESIRSFHGSSGLPALMTLNDEMRMSVLHVDMSQNGTPPRLVQEHYRILEDIVSVSSQYSNQFALILKTSDEYILAVWDNSFRTLVQSQSLGLTLSNQRISVYFYGDYVYVVDGCSIYGIHVTPVKLKLSDLLHEANLKACLRNGYEEKYTLPFNGKKLTTEEEDQIRKVGEEKLVRMLSEFLRNIRSDCLETDFNVTPFQWNDHHVYLIDLMCSVPYTSSQLVLYLRKMLPLADAMFLLRYFVTVISQSLDVERAIDWITVIIDAFIGQIQGNDEFSDLIRQLSSIVDFHMSYHKTLISLTQVQDKVEYGRIVSNDLYKFELVKFF